MQFLIDHAHPAAALAAGRGQRRVSCLQLGVCSGPVSVDPICPQPTHIPYYY